MFALFGHDAIEKAPARGRELRAVGKEKASQGHRQEEFKRSNAGIAREGEHGSGQRLQMGSHLAQGRSKVAGCLSPEFVKLRTDERPILDALGRRWNHQATSAQIFSELPQPVQGTQAKPGRWSDDDPEIDEGENCRRGPWAIAEKSGKEDKDGIEPDREHKLEDHVSHQGPEQGVPPRDLVSEQADWDRKLHHVSARTM